MRRAAAASTRLMWACAIGERSTNACAIRGSVDVVGVAALPGEKTQILVTPHGLADAEFHVVAFHPHWLEMISYSIGYTKSVLAQFGKAPIE